MFTACCEPLIRNYYEPCHFKEASLGLTAYPGLGSWLALVLDWENIGTIRPPWDYTEHYRAPQSSSVNSAVTVYMQGRASSSPQCFTQRYGHLLYFNHRPVLISILHRSKHCLA